ncbi:MAG TPA: nucleoside triphosphate pyrophosphatase [Myxococcaceae bacterium]|nr:nucleoside triphosphate pyrophosphatase [Myxococcaceae bacterium]
MSASPFSELVLASTSPARRALMQSLRVPFRPEAPEVVEDFPPGTHVGDAVAMLAERKARAVFERNPSALVVGCDQLAALDGAALGKPSDRAAAREQLMRLSGRTHQIVTGLCLLGSGVRELEVDVAHLTAFPLEPDEIERYVDLGEWEGCAGGYRVEAAGQALFREIAGDRAAVMGLPMVRLVNALRRLGWRFFE